MSVKFLEKTNILSWKSIQYDKIGEGKTIIFLHGIPLDRKALKNPVEDFFKDNCGYQRIYLDLPGMGKTGRIDNVKCADDMVNILQEFINNVIGNNSFLLVGQSYGGYLSLGLLHKNLNNIDGIFLLCPCTVPDRTKRMVPPKKNIQWNDPFISKYKNNEAFVDYLDFTQIRNEYTWEKYQEDVISGMKMADLDFISQLQATGYEFTFNRELKNIYFKKPSTILTGSHDTCVGYEDAFKFNSNFEHLTFTVLDNTGHNLQIEQHELFKVYFEEWISRTESKQIIK